MTAGAAGRRRPSPEDQGEDAWQGWLGGFRGSFWHQQSLSYVPEIIRTELIGRHHVDPLAGHFGIENNRELVARKYHGDLQSLPIPTHRWKGLSMDFVTGLPISTDWKGTSYNSILVIVDRLTKIVHYQLVQITTDAPGLAEVIIDVIVQHSDATSAGPPRRIYPWIL